MIIKKYGFSLMDMMIALLIVAVAAAASAPMVNIASQLKNASPWNNTNDGNDSIVFGTKNNKNQKVFIGRTSAPSSSYNAKLYIDTPDANLPQIALGSGTDQPYRLWTTSGSGISLSKSTSAPLDGSVSIGTNSNASSAVAIGYNASVVENSTAIGTNSNAAANYSISVGHSANPIGENAIVIAGAEINSSGTANSASADENSVLIGYKASAPKNSVALGEGASIGASDEQSVVIGKDAKGSSNSVSIGSGVNSAAQSVTIGNLVKSSSNRVSIGATSTNNADSIAIGTQATAGSGGIAIGSMNAKDGTTTITTAGPNCIALGEGTSAKGQNDNSIDNSIAVGSRSSVVGNSIALGSSIHSTFSAVAVGTASVAGNGGVSIGTIVKSDKAGVAMGHGAEANGENSIAIGYASQAKANGSIAIGQLAVVEQDNNVAVGTSDHIVKIPSTKVAMGTEASANDNEILLGTEDTTVRIPGKLKVTNLDLSGLTETITLGNSGATVYIPGNIVVDRSCVLGRDASNAKVWIWTYRQGDWGNPSSNSIRALNRKGDNSTHVSNSVYGFSNGGSLSGFSALSSSDRRLKNVGEVFKGGLAELKKLELYHYTYKKDPDKIPQVGIMAQDLQKVFPQAVFEGEDGYLRIRWDEMFFALINAVKELDDKIEKAFSKYSEIAKLEKEVDSLKKKNTELKERVTYMKEHVISMKQDIESLEE